MKLRAATSSRFAITSTVGVLFLLISLLTSGTAAAAPTPTRTATPTQAATTTPTRTSTRTATVTDRGSDSNRDINPYGQRYCYGNADQNRYRDPDYNCDGDAHSNGDSGGTRDSNRDINSYRQRYCHCNAD